MSDLHDVPKMVGVYKKLFTILITITVLGIGVAYLHLPAWLAIILALGIIALKGAAVWSSFKHLLTGKSALLITFGLTAIFFAGVVILPCLNQNGHITDTVDLSKEYQAQQKPVEVHHGH